MANQKQSFAKLTEDLDKLKNEPVVKSEEPKEEPKVEEGKEQEPKVKIEEVVPAVAEVPVVQPEAVEPKVEEGEAVEKGGKCSDCGKPKADCTCDDKKDNDDDKKDDKKDAKKQDNDKKDDDKKDDKPVKKSAEDVEVETVSEADIVGAFEAVVKSFGGLKSDVKSELAELKKSIADLFELIKPAAPAVEEPVAKSAEPAEEPKEEEKPEGEVVEKSVEQPVDDEGKSVEYISKSNGIPEGVQPEGEEPPAEEPVFNAMSHVKEVTEYFVKNASRLNEGEKFALRGAVNRVKRGEGTQTDIDIFRQIAGN